MHKLPVVSSAKVVKIASKLGYEFVRQKGSHIILKNEKGEITVIPNRKTLKKGTLLQIIKALGITKEEFSKLV
ncbi:type II toxin-antitoxin system HicA family toxin [Candidatus Micrarchaeota archaeon]|nr:type II toxin-antitoxin system HicA family toxin [Candidatus Micrarchaeota archaeon]MBU2476829.1 type II toxin-antitoxin system HicA family toxin [Candidatus Micrarchaeota archaeon]